MNKIDTRAAFPTDDRETVSGHFGHCRYFAVFNISDGKIISTEYLDAPKHAPGVLPNFLVSSKINVLIAGGMGKMAKDMLAEKNVEVVLGAEGSIKNNLDTYLQGDLYSRGSVCDHNHGEHDCDH